MLGLTRDSEPIGLALLVARRTKVLGVPVRTLSLINDAYNTHGHVLSSALDGPAVCALFAALFELPVAWDVFRLSNVLQGQDLFRHLAEAMPRRWPPHLLRDGHASYYLELPSRYEEYLGSRSSGFRNHLKRTERRLHAQADVVVRGYFALIECSGWKGRQRSSLAHRDDLAAFFLNYCTRASELDRLRITLLYFGPEVAAAEIAIDAYGRRWGLKVAYREDLARFLRLDST